MATPGRSFKVLSFALLAVGVIIGMALGPDENPAVILAAPFLIGGVLAHFRGRQEAAKAAARGRSMAEPAGGARVLYLRSFREDVSTTGKVLMAGMSSEEEQLAEVLAPLGRMVAIGRPGEPLPIPGAERVYANDDQWKSRVVELLRTSRLVVIRVGSSSGLHWELTQAFACLRPEQLLLFAFRCSADDYAGIAARVLAQSRVVLPQIERLGLLHMAGDLRDSPTKLRPVFIRFAAGWKAELLAIQMPLARLGYDDFVAGFNDALRPVFAFHGVEWTSRGRGFARLRDV